MYNNNKSTRESPRAANRLHNELQDDLETIKQKMRETRDALSQTAYDVSGKAEAYITKSFKDAKAKSSDLQDSVVGYVRANPVKSIAYAFLCGVVFSKMMRK